MDVFIQQYGQGVGHTIPQGSYKIVDILILIQFRLDALKVPLTIYLSDKNRVTLKLIRRVVVKDDVTSLYFNEYLSKMLGFRDVNKVLGFTRNFIHT